MRTSNPEKFKALHSRTLTKVLKSKELSETDTEFLCKNRSKKSLSHHATLLNRWVRFCMERKIHPCEPTLDQLVAYFMHPHELFPVSKTLFNYFAALCKILAQSSLLLLENPLFAELRYAAQRDCQVLTLPQKTTWDPEVVLDFIKKLPAPEQMTKVDLSARYLVLLLLVSGRRKIDLHRLDVRPDFMRKTDDCFYFAMSKFAKGHKCQEDHNFMQFIEFAKFPRIPECAHTQ